MARRAGGMLCCSCWRLMVVAFMLSGVSSWQSDWQPSATITLHDEDSVQRFLRRDSETDDFRLLLAEGDTMLVAARNALYNISMITLRKLAEIEWSPDQAHIDVCQKRQKSLVQCQNYIRVLVKSNSDTLYVCGTNAFKPTCRTYYQLDDGSYEQDRKGDTSGVAVCPFDPSHNTTAIYADGKLYSATVSDFNSRDPLILENTKMVRTEQFDSKWLNEPNFVSSFEKDDKVYFFFRETAVENINCGKAVFSRVGRVCKEDSGGKILLNQKFTSFFKARLNCSIPGDFPFYFDEIQSTTEMGKGNYKPTFDSGERYDMVYGVFNTPENSIQGSAVCAFRYTDIIRTFEGRFKGQESVWHNWLAVPSDATPQPHPQQCTNQSQVLPDTTLNFIKTHPLMNSAVPANGGAPLLIHTSFRAQFTKIAVDWMVHAADERYYDVMFVGTDDGRVIKAVNAGSMGRIETVVIEDIRVFGPHDPVTDLKVFRDKSKKIEKLIVMSKENVISIPLHRCGARKTCRTCVELRDPYCAWDSSRGRCDNTEGGIQNVVDGLRNGSENECREVTIYEEMLKESREEETSPEPRAEKCSCPPVKDNGDDYTASVEDDIDTVVVIEGDNSVEDKYGDSRFGGPRVGQSSEQTPLTSQTASASIETLAIAIVVSIVLSMLIGFFIGYKVAVCRGSNNSDASYMERTCSLQRSRNRLSSGEHPYFNPDAMMPKQMNYVVNVKGKLNSSVETKPVTKSNKVYL